MSTRAQKLNQWFESPLGERLLIAEKKLMQQILPHLFGYYLTQIEGMGDGRLLESSRIIHRYILTSSFPTTQLAYPEIWGKMDALPFANDSLDVVVVPHVLEFAEDPHVILRETYRVLIPEGHLIILGFNPLSLWGLWHWFLSRREEAPWCGEFLPVVRVKEWLSVLGFEKIEQHTLFFAPPFHHAPLMNTLEFLDRFGRRRMKDFGAVYCLVAKKRVATLTPIKPKWSKETILPSSAPVGSR